jgi:hypothetical protein
MGKKLMSLKRLSSIEAGGGGGWRRMEEEVEE